MSEKYVPEATVTPATTQEGNRALMIQHRQAWLGHLSSRRADSWDGYKDILLDKVNLNEILDHWPHGSPRDHLVPSAHTAPHEKPRTQYA